MPDVLGYRAKIAILLPSTNTIMEPELYAMAPPGVTFQVGRMYVPQADLTSPEATQQFIENVSAATHTAMRDVLTTEPDYLLHGMTALSFMNGLDGSVQFKQRLEQASGLRTSTAAEAVRAALKLLGVKRLGILSPQPEMLDAHYERFFTESGYEPVRFQHIHCPTAVAIGQVDEATLRAAAIELNGSDIEAIVLMGADLASARFADEAERWLGKPFISVTTAVLWHALRACGISDAVRGFGALLRDQ